MKRRIDVVEVLICVLCNSPSLLQNHTRSYMFYEGVSTRLAHTSCLRVLFHRMGVIERYTGDRQNQYPSNLADLCAVCSLLYSRMGVNEEADKYDQGVAPHIWPMSVAAYRLPKKCYLVPPQCCFSNDLWTQKGSEILPIIGNAKRKYRPGSWKVNNCCPAHRVNMKKRHTLYLVSFVTCVTACTTVNRVIPVRTAAF